MEQLMRIFTAVKRLSAGVNNPAHAGKSRGFSYVDRGDQIHLKTGIDVVDVRFAHRSRQMNHTLGTNFLERIDERGQITDVAAYNR